MEQRVNCFKPQHRQNQGLKIIRNVKVANFNLFQLLNCKDTRLKYIQAPPKSKLFKAKQLYLRSSISRPKIHLLLITLERKAHRKLTNIVIGSGRKESQSIQK